jgi:hypothetical protein
VYDFEYRNADDCVFNKLVFVLWSPNGAQLKNKMLYASTVGGYHLLTVVHSLYKSSTQLFHCLLQLKRPR